MKKTLIYLATIALLAGCRRSSETLKREQQQQYVVVQEGQTSGVTSSTINAPGEAPPAPAGMTGTNADTTSNFSLPQTTMTTGSVPQGTIASTLPATSTETPRPKPAPRPRPAPPPTNVEPPPVTSTIPPNTDTAPPPPPATDTQPQTTTTT